MWTSHLWELLWKISPHPQDENCCVFMSEPWKPLIRLSWTYWAMKPYASCTLSAVERYQKRNCTSLLWRTQGCSDNAYKAPESERTAIYLVSQYFPTIEFFKNFVSKGAHTGLIEHDLRDVWRTVPIFNQSFPVEFLIKDTYACSSVWLSALARRCWHMR